MLTSFGHPSIRRRSLILSCPRRWICWERWCVPEEAYSPRAFFLKMNKASVCAPPPCTTSLLSTLFFGGSLFEVMVTRPITVLDWKHVLRLVVAACFCRFAVVFSIGRVTNRACVRVGESCAVEFFFSVVCHPPLARQLCGDGARFRRRATTVTIDNNSMHVPLYFFSSLFYARSLACRAGVEGRRRLGGRKA